MTNIKGIVHSKMNPLLNLKLFQNNESFSSAEHKRRYFEENVDGPH